MHVYLITNKINNKKYIGYTKNSVEERFKNHVYDANSGSDRRLQRAIRKYGKESFIIETLETVNSIDELKLKEIELIEKFKPEYNMTKGGDGVNDPTVSEKYNNYMKLIRPYQIAGKNNPFYGKKHSEETKEINRQKHLGKKHTEKSKELIRKANTGRKMSEESIAKFVEKTSQIWEITTPSGEIIIIKNLAKFCRKNDLDQRNMTKVAAGIYKTSKGYKCKKVENIPNELPDCNTQL